MAGTPRGCQVDVLKLKGVGARTHTGDVLGPTTLPIRNPNPHFGIDELGEFVPKLAQPAPLGAITLARAGAEFEIANHLVEHGCPSVVPMAVYEYPDLKFAGAPTGVVVTGYPATSSMRADALMEQRPEDEQELSRWSAAVLADGKGGQRSERAALLQSLTEMYGRTLREFAESGCYRYSGALDNYAYSPTLGRVFLIDLDSSRMLAGISHRARALEVLRDLASGLAYLVAALSKPGCPMDRTEWRLRDPFGSMIAGYWPYAQQAAARAASDLLCDLTEQLAEKAQPTESPGETSSESRAEAFRAHIEFGFVRPWAPREIIFSHAMTAAFVCAPPASRPIRWAEFLRRLRGYAPDGVADRIARHFLERGLGEARLGVGGRRE